MPYLAGETYTIADIACYAWTLGATKVIAEPLAETLRETPALHRWLETVGARPAVQRGMKVPQT